METSPPQLTRPKKSLGQNFLVDRRVVGKIIRATDLKPDDVVIEVGPGRGILTRALADAAGRVMAVELDDSLSESLAQALADRTNVTVVHGDARELDIAAVVGPGTPYKVVANLPYYAASAIVRRFLEADHKPSLMVVTVQREVAQNMTAPPGKMGLLSVAVQVYGKARIAGSVPPKAFRPAPKVTSAIVRIDLYDAPAVPFASAAHFFTLVRAGFSSRRKQIHNSLKHELPISSEQVLSMLAVAGIDPVRRAETLNMTEWGGLYRAYAEGSPATGIGQDLSQNRHDQADPQGIR